MRFYYQFVKLDKMSPVSPKANIPIKITKAIINPQKKDLEQFLTLMFG